MPRHLIEDGPDAGWYQWHRDADGRFQSMLGALLFRADAGGQVHCRIATERKHSNGMGYLHGGFIMSFIDMAMFTIIFAQLEKSSAVTLSCATDFLTAGIVGEPLEASGEILKETGKMLFVRGLVTQRGENVASFTGTMRKVPRAPRLATPAEPAPAA